jgi:hemerythrin
MRPLASIVAWNPAFAIGVPEIDAQHEELFERAGRFAAAVQASKPPDRLEELFAFLAEYALEHFELEERFMRRLGYPRLVQHMEEHVRLRRQLASLVPQWNTEGASQGVLLALVGFLSSWLADHVAGSDQQFADHVRGLGSGPPPPDGAVVVP